MQNEALEALRGADAVVLVVDGRHKTDPELVKDLPPKKTVCAVNKVDLIRPKSMMLPVLQAWTALFDFAAIVPISARTGSGVRTLVEEVTKLVPVGMIRCSTPTSSPTGPSVTSRPRWSASRSSCERAKRCPTASP